MTLDELTHENKILQEQAVKLEQSATELRIRMQENNVSIGRQLDEMNSTSHDCTLCMGECHD